VFKEAAKFNWLMMMIEGWEDLPFFFYYKIGATNIGCHHFLGDRLSQCLDFLDYN
jgi:hypothetical protein